MKAIFKRILPIIGLSILAPTFISCSEQEDTGTSSFEYASFENIASLEDDTEYLNSTVDNGPDDNGIVVCPYHTLKVNGKDVPLYGTRTANGIHSFAYIFVDAETVDLKVEITSIKKWKSIDVLPKSKNVVAETSEGNTTAKINDFGSFSFAFNQKSDQPVTLMVVKKDNFELPEGYALKEYEPRKYEKEELEFSDTKTAYYFRKGNYEVNTLYFPSDCVVYFEPGTYLKDYQYSDTDYTTLFRSNKQKNIRIYGNPLVDFSCHQGGPAGYQSKGQFSFTSCENVILENFISINPSSWTMCFTNCTNVEVRENILFGYKTCSDGIMLSDCQDCLVHDNFVRTGDDAIEAKSTGTIGSKNLVYEYNAVWSDKARCYGCIYESNNDMENIIFRHNSVGFELANWGDGVGCLAIILGTNEDVVWKDIHFEDTEIYYTKGRAIVFGLASSSELLNYGGGTAKDIYFKDTRILCERKAWSEIIKIKISNCCTLGKIYISNLTYVNYYDETVKYTHDDTEDTTLTSIWSESAWSKKNIEVE